jgi:RNA polymerase sigma-70 factor (ECF subfamily)
VPTACAPSPPTADVLVLDGHGGNEQLSDRDLVQRARAGQEWAHAMIYRRHVGLVANAAQRLLRNTSDVDDVVQETFLIAFEKLGSLIDAQALRAWLVKIAVNRAHRRYRWRRFVALVGGEDPSPIFEQQASTAASPEQLAELALIDRALSRLPYKLRTPWVLRHAVGCQLEEVAEACGCSLATAKRRIAEAEACVRLHLEGPS